MHMFAQPETAADLTDFAAELGCRAVFSQPASGGPTFAEACVEPWLKLTATFPDKPVPIGCIAATLELRGFIDIRDDLAASDVSALMNSLRRRGYLAGTVRPSPVPLCDVTGFDACDVVRTPVFGIIVYRAELGQTVTDGQPIADIVNPHAIGEDGRITVRARTNGVVVTRRLKKLVSANQVIAKVAGTKALAHRKGYLLED
jgi:hypothetical protein